MFVFLSLGCSQSEKKIFLKYTESAELSGGNYIVCTQFPLLTHNNSLNYGMAKPAFHTYHKNYSSCFSQTNFVYLRTASGEELHRDCKL